MPRDSTPCVTCSAPSQGAYCAACGEKRVDSDDRSVGQMIGHTIEATTNANGKAWLTLKTLLRHPGRLTGDFIRGRRKPYVAPLQLFLLANLIFFLLHPLVGSNTLTTTLATHLHYTWYRQVAQSMVASHLAHAAITPEAYAALFDAAAVIQAKSFVILVVPIFSIAVVALYWRRRRNYVDHLVFAAHTCTLWLLGISAILALTNLTIRLLRTMNVFPSAEQVSTVIGGVTLAGMAVYLFQAARVVFKAQAMGLMVAKAIVLGVAFDLSLEAYRFALFFITFWST
jgi:hypothetical protein